MKGIIEDNMDVPERLTRQYWNRELKLQRISPERTKEFFEAVMGKYYTKPLNLYIGNDGMYYVYFPNVFVNNNKKNDPLLDKTGITKNIIVDRATRKYKTLDEQTLRDVLFNISCVAYDTLQNWDTNDVSICKRWGPLYREKRKMFINGGPVPDCGYKTEEDNECMAAFSTYGPRILKTIVSEDETNAVLNAIYGKTDNCVILMFDKVRKEYFIQEEMRSLNHYDRFQISCDFDYDYLEQYVHIYEKYNKPQDDNEYWKISDYFRNSSIANLRIIKTGLLQNMLIPNSKNIIGGKYELVSFENLQKAYSTIIYNHRDTW